jgi:exodeoxyribonuclease VII large subunit
MQRRTEDFADTLTVSALNREARRLLETGLGRVSVEGELSNVSRPASGHMYWTLKDSTAQVRCAMFRQANRSLPFRPADGQQVVVHARVSLYEPRGDYQLIVDAMEEAGEGLLRRRFEALKRKLADEGLFDAARKQPVPAIPARIGVITSPTGAAIRDVLIALGRRFPAASVLIYPTSVQGTAAAAEIVAALELADARAECDVLILTRGGGSLEDLWPFNEEIVARAVARLRLPVIVGVGHEVDFTIADFVADVRAPTPSQAAELAVPVQAQLESRLAEIGTKLARSIGRELTDVRAGLGHLAHRLSRVHPRIAIEGLEQRIDDIEARMLRALKQERRDTAARLDRARARLAHAHPLRRITALRDALNQLRRSLEQSVAMRIERLANRTALAERGLRTLSPLATLERGYAIVTRADDGALVTRSTDATEGRDVDIRLAEGGLSATVTRRQG